MTTRIRWRHGGTTIGTAGDGGSRAARAALIGRLAPSGVVARRTAAWIWGLDVLPPGPDEPEWDIDLAKARDLPPAHTTVESGVRLTTPARTALDCARWLPRAEAVAALDQFLRHTDVAALTLMARDLKDYRDSTRLREVLRLGDRGAASPGESRTRLLILSAGFPRPRTHRPRLRGVPRRHGVRR
jgi:hypothetical protein